MKKQEFIEKAIQKFGTRFDYSKVDYKNLRTSIIVKCNKHGDFNITPRQLLEGKITCPICYAEEKAQEFTNKAKNIHKDKYDYSKVKWVNSKTKVTIICPVHGEFEQEPLSHLKGCGCPKCAVQTKKNNNCNKLTLSSFIDKANIIHNNRYDYSKISKMENNKTKITIICSIHGEFEQTPNNHLNGQGCPLCAKEAHTLSKEDFIIKANKVHGNKYNYSKVCNPKYGNKIIIICPEHGEFEQFVNNHLQGSGCPKCQSNYILTQEQFIKKCTFVHQNKYDYSKTKYINARTKVTVTCPIHGDFEQSAQAHLSGHGCPNCKKSKGELIIKQYLETNNIEYIDQYKVDINNYINSSGKAFVDFFLPKYNTIIEYNGKQHYVPVEYFGGELAFNKQQQRDQEIQNYCFNNNLSLLEIKYTDNIIEVLNNYFKNETV